MTQRVRTARDPAFQGLRYTVLHGTHQGIDCRQYSVITHPEHRPRCFLKRNTHTHIPEQSIAVSALTPLPAAAVVMTLADDDDRGGMEATGNTLVKTSSIADWHSALPCEVAWVTRSTSKANKQATSVFTACSKSFQV